MCDYPDCDLNGIINSKLSKDGQLIINDVDSMQIKNRYEKFSYCKVHYEYIMNNVIK